ncbi:MAG: PAS domain S-box protein [Smithella sp.]
MYIIQRGKFVYVSELYQKISGYKDAEIIGTDSFINIYHEDRGNVRKTGHKTFEEGKL